MTSTSLRRTLLPLAAMILLLAACSDDDPVSPDPPLWQEVTLDLGDGESRLAAIDFTGDHSVAMNLKLTTRAGGTRDGLVHEFFRLQPDGSWLKESQDDIPTSMVAMDLDLDATGDIVLAGYQIPGPPSVVLDLRGPTAAYIQQGTYGMLTVTSDETFAVASGRASGGGLWSSTAPGNWNFDTLPLTGTNDSGFRDVDIRDGRAVACGYDDGGDTLQVILTRTATSDWEKIQPAGPFTRTYFCIALSAEGTIFIGGIEGAGGMSPKAFLAQRSTAGEWIDLVLPDPELLHGVMDILIADDGDLYLACMGEGDQTEANLIHAGPDGVKKEITPFAGGLLQVGQSAGGDIYAVGIRRDEQTGVETGVMLIRTP